MRTVLLALALLGALVALAPPTASAHQVDCVWGDMSCWLKCQVGHVKDPLGDDHKCRWIFYPYPTP